MTLSVRTLLFTDIEGSTSLLDRAGSEYPALLGVHRRIVRAAVEHTGGIEHRTAAGEPNTPENAFRVWVQLREIDEGSWGAGGTIWRFAEITNFVSGQ